MSSSDDETGHPPKYVHIGSFDISSAGKEPGPSQKPKSEKSGAQDTAGTSVQEAMQKQIQEMAKQMQSLTEQLARTQKAMASSRTAPPKPRSASSAPQGEKSPKKATSRAESAHATVSSDEESEYRQGTSKQTKPHSSQRPKAHKSPKKATKEATRRQKKAKRAGLPARFVKLTDDETDEEKEFKPPKVSKKKPEEPDQRTKKERYQNLPKEVVAVVSGKAVTLKWYWDGSDHAQPRFHAKGRRFMRNFVSAPPGPAGSGDTGVVVYQCSKGRTKGIECPVQVYMTGGFQYVKGDPVSGHALNCCEEFEECAKAEMMAALGRHARSIASGATWNEATCIAAGLKDWTPLERRRAGLHPEAERRCIRRIRNQATGKKKGPTDLDYVSPLDDPIYLRDLGQDGNPSVIKAYDSGPASDDPDGERFAIFIDPAAITEAMLSRCDAISADGSYKCKPRLYAQYFSVQGRIVLSRDANLRPVHYAWTTLCIMILSRHTATVYTKAFNKMLELLGPSFSPSLACLDFEVASGSALVRAMEAHSKHISLQGCLYHGRFSVKNFLSTTPVLARVTVNGKVVGKEMKMLDYVLQTPRALAQVQVLLQLAFLPARLIGEMADLILSGNDDAGHPVLDPGLKSLEKYLRTVWVGWPNGKASTLTSHGRHGNRYLLSHWSVHDAALAGLPMSSTSAESFHKLMNKVAMHNPNYFGFVQSVATILTLRRETQYAIEEYDRTTTKTAETYDALNYNFSSPQSSQHVKSDAASDPEPDYSQHSAEESDEAESGTEDEEEHRPIIVGNSVTPIRRLSYVQKRQNIKHVPFTGQEVDAKTAELKRNIKEDKKKDADLRAFYEVKQVPSGYMPLHKARKTLTRTFHSRVEGIFAFNAYESAGKRQILEWMKKMASRDNMLGSGRRLKWSPPAEETLCASGDEGLSDLPETSSLDASLHHNAVQPPAGKQVDGGSQAVDVASPLGRDTAGHVKPRRRLDEKTDYSLYGAAKSLGQEDSSRPNQRLSLSQHKHRVRKDQGISESSGSNKSKSSIQLSGNSMGGGSSLASASMGDAFGDSSFGFGLRSFGQALHAGASTSAFPHASSSASPQLLASKDHLQQTSTPNTSGPQPRFSPAASHTPIPPDLSSLPPTHQVSEVSLASPSEASFYGGTGDYYASDEQHSDIRRFYAPVNVPASEHIKGEGELTDDSQQVSPSKSPKKKMQRRDGKVSSLTREGRREEEGKENEPEPTHDAALLVLARRYHKPYYPSDNAKPSPPLTRSRSQH